MASAPRKKARKARPAGPLSPVKRAHGGKATSSVGLARSMDRNYKRFVMFENRARYLADPEHHGVLRGEHLDGDQDLLQEELDLMRKHSAMSLERLRGIEREMKRSAFALALVDKGEALAKPKAKRDPSSSLISLVERKEHKERTKVAANSNNEADYLKQVTLAAGSYPGSHALHIAGYRITPVLVFWT